MQRYINNAIYRDYTNDLAAEGFRVSPFLASGLALIERNAPLPSQDCIVGYAQKGTNDVRVMILSNDPVLRAITDTRGREHE